MDLGRHKGETLFIRVSGAHYTSIMGSEQCEIYGLVARVNNNKHQHPQVFPRCNNSRAQDDLKYEELL